MWNIMKEIGYYLIGFQNTEHDPHFARANYLKLWIEKLQVCLVLYLQVTRMEIVVVLRKSYKWVVIK